MAKETKKTPYLLALLWSVCVCVCVCVYTSPAKGWKPVSVVLSWIKPKGCLALKAWHTP